MVLYSTSSIVTFIANGERQMFKLMCDATLDTIEDSILDKFVNYRIQSLCVNGKNVFHPYIKDGYMIVEGKMGEMLISEGKNNFFPIKNMDKIMMLGLAKGDVLHLKGVSSFTVEEVDYGNNVLCVELR